MDGRRGLQPLFQQRAGGEPRAQPARDGERRSEERRVGKECRSGWWAEDAEDGIRDKLVTGVQTCALPISCPAINKRGRIAPTTAMIGNECRSTKVRILTDSRWMGVEACSHCFSSERVASHERNPREMASADRKSTRLNSSH